MEFIDRTGFTQTWIINVLMFRRHAVTCPVCTSGFTSLRQQETEIRHSAVCSPFISIECIKKKKDEQTSFHSSIEEVDSNLSIFHEIPLKKACDWSKYYI